MENRRDDKPALKPTPTFLKSVVAPTDTRVTMKGLGKMCSGCCYGT